MWAQIAVTALTLLALDAAYISVVAKRHFQDLIARVQGKSMQVNYLAAAWCYVWLIAGLYYFVVLPRRTPTEAFFLGCVIYGVYETTTMALVREWSWHTVLMDTLWGGALFALTTYFVQNSGL
jgi:uncharacterized membrane protein